MIAVPPPKYIPKMESIASPLQNIDFSKMPDINYYKTRDGSNLAFRQYINKNAKQTIVLVHGSSGSSRSVYPLSFYLNQQGLTVYALDLRGHGKSGKKGDINYVGQLEDDMEDFIHQVLKNEKAILMGFSAGGGFVLRFAASERQNLFNRYILLSPYIQFNSPTVKSESDSWAKSSFPRILGISLLGPIGRNIFGHLPVITFAINPETIQYQTSQYSFRLARNLYPHLDYKSDISLVKHPLTILVGDKDELHDAYAFKPLFASIKPDTKIVIVSGVDHITLTTSLAGMSAIAKAVIVINE